MSLTLRSPVRLLAVLLLVLALFGAALVLGRASAPSGPQSAPGPVPLNAAASSPAVISLPLASVSLPALRHPKPKPKPVVTPAVAPASPSSSSVAASSAPVTPVPVAPVAPAPPAASSGGGGGGGGGGGVIISH